MFRSVRAQTIKIELPGAFLLACAAFLWLNRGGFALGYFGEDYLWLYRIEHSSFVQALSPTQGNFYRPLSVNVPYYLFTRLSHGLLWWKLTAALVTLVGYGVLWRWLTETTGHAWPGFALATLWLFHPSNAYGLYYPNAFDYAFFAPLLILLLYALERRAWKTALPLLVAGCLSKELAFGFPLLFLLHRREMPRWVLAAAFALPLAIATAHQGFGAGHAGGFPLDFSPREIAGRFGYLVRHVFFGKSSVAWHLFAWALCLLGAGLALFRGGRRAFVASQRFLLPLAAFFLPLTLLEIFTRDLGPIYWVFLLANAAIGFRHAPDAFRRAAIGAGAGALSAAISLSSPHLREHYTRMAKTHAEFLESAALRLRDCGLLDHVVLRGMETIDPFPDNAEWLVWGLMRKLPEARFYLLSPARYVSPHYPLLWVEERQTGGHPVLLVAGENGEIRLDGPRPPCRGARRKQEIFNRE